MTRDVPLVSIGMPVYNGGEFLAAALESLLGQTFADFELIICDNGSTDETAETCRRFADADPRIRFQRNDANIGPIRNFNQTLDLARGEYFMWAAHDDLWEPDFIAELVSLLRTSAAVLAFCAFDNVDTKNRPVLDYDLSELGSSPMGDRLHRYLVHDERLGKANLVYGLTRRAALVRVGGMKPWGPENWGIDMHAVFRLLCEGPFAFTSRKLFHKRRPNDADPPPGLPDRMGFGSYLRILMINPRDWREYFRGYMERLSTVEGLPPLQRLRLRAAVRFRMAQVSLARKARRLQRALEAHAA